MNALAVEVIMPVLNGGAAFRRSLAAVRALAYDGPLSLIVVDDGSTDGSDALALASGARVLRTGAPRSGPAAARNLGAAHSSADVLLFVDADVEARPDALARAAAFLASHPQHAAVFGSYDDAPDHPAFVSQAKNLFHHLTHQTASEDAGTFWAGLGAVRRSAFDSAGGFDAARYPRPCIEDIELGDRLIRAGHHIHLDKSLQGKHLKRWTWLGWLRSDLLDRGIPWMRLLLERRSGRRDLNLDARNRASVACVGLLCASLAASAVAWQSLAAALVLACALLVINRNVYVWFASKRGWSFALRAIPWHWAYYAIGLVSAVAGTAAWLADGRRSLAADPPARSGQSGR